MFDGIKHTHTLLVTLFLLSSLVKTFILLADKKEMLGNYRQKLIIPEMILAILLLATGLYMWHDIGWGDMAGWFHLKITLVVLAIPLGIVGFRKQNKILSTLSTLMLVYVFVLAFTKHITLF
jgi:uncharacterized membrane protein SirB2